MLIIIQNSFLLPFKSWYFSCFLYSFWLIILSAIKYFFFSCHETIEFTKYPCSFFPFLPSPLPFLRLPCRLSNISRTNHTSRWNWWIRVKHFLALNAHLPRLTFGFFFILLLFQFFFSFAWFPGSHCVLTLLRLRFYHIFSWSMQCL